MLLLAMVIGSGQNTDRQSMDYPDALPEWTNQMEYPKN